MTLMKTRVHYGDVNFGRIQLNAQEHLDEFNAQQIKCSGYRKL